MKPFDAHETQSPEVREGALLERVRQEVARARQASPYWREKLSGHNPEAINSRAALADLPVLRKSELIELQQANPPFGGLATEPAGAMLRLFVSPGPIVEPQGRGSVSPWRMERAMHAAGFKTGDRVANCFSYHFTPAGFMFDAACQELGCAVFPGGVGQSEAQAAAFSRLGINGYVGTPDFLATILEKAASPIERMERALVSGGPLFPSLREGYEQRGISVRQCYATAELGLIAYETDDPAVGMALDEDVLVEIVRPGTGSVVPDGEVGEVVVTTFNEHYPLIRLATGDLSAIAPPCTDAAGRTAVRLKGWMGRADQSTKVRGLFVHPSQVAAAVAGIPEVKKARLEVSEEDGQDRMRFLVETEEGNEGLASRLVDAMRAETRLRADVEFVRPGALPNDGKVINDTRSVQ